MPVQDRDVDAFISYRHEMPDMAIATRLLRLLHKYRAPRKCKCAHCTTIKRIFRDTEGLPIGSDLNDEIHEYLRRSRFLIVVCTEKILESSYCIDEIDYFRKQHGDSIENILIVLADPVEDVLSPAEKERTNRLLSKVLGIRMIEKQIPITGQITSTLEIEPHYADARALTLRKQKKLVKSEYLRIAAVLLGCEYDDLNRWHFRRRAARIAASSACAVAASLAVAYVIAGFAYRTWRAEIEARDMNASLYYQKSVNSMAVESDVQAALFEATQAAALSADNALDANVRASLLFQSGTWGYMSDSRTGAFVDGYALAWGAEVEGTVEVADSVDLSRVLAVGNGGQSLLLNGGSGLFVVSPDGAALDAPDSAFQTLLASDGDACWVLGGRAGSFLAYDPRTGAGSALSYPAGVESGTFLVSQGGALIALVSGGRAYFYDGADGSYALRDEEGLALDGFADMTAGAALSPDGNILIVRSYMQLAAVATKTGKTLFTRNLSEISQFDLIARVVFSPDSRSVAIAYGANPIQSVLNAKGYVAVYNYRGELLFSSADATKAPVVGCAFSADGTMLAARDADGIARVYACVDDAWTEACVPMYVGAASTEIGFAGSTGLLAVADSDSKIDFYRYASLGDRVALRCQGNGHTEIEYAMVDAAGIAVVTPESVVQYGNDGSVLGVTKQGTAEFDALIAGYIQSGEIQNVSSAVSSTLSQAKATAWSIGDGLSFLLDGHAVEVVDADGAIVASAKFAYGIGEPLAAYDATSGTLAVAAGGLQDGSEKTYATRLYTFRYDAGTQAIVRTEYMSKAGFYPDSIWMFGDQGVAAVASTYGELILLDIGNPAGTARYLRAGAYDAIDQVVMGEDGLMALVAEYRDSADTNQYEKVELWNAATGVLLFEDDAHHIYAGAVRLSGGALYYSLGYTLYRMEISTLDGAAWRNVMLGVSGYALDEDGNMVRTVARGLTAQLDQAEGIVTADQPNTTE